MSVLQFLFAVSPIEKVLGPLTNSEDRRGRDVLRDEGAWVQLVRPDLPSPDSPDAIPLVVVDQVRYLPTAPWPDGAAGGGKSLTRTRAEAYGLFATSWVAAAPSPGSAQFSARAAGDANGDGRFDHLDLQRVRQSGKYRTGEPARFDEGDWDGDGVFDSLDLVVALQAGSYLGPPTGLDAGAG
jgi:hypothetical protein